MGDSLRGQKFSIRRLARLQTALVVAILVWFVVGVGLTRLGLYPPTFPPAGEIGLVAIIAGTFARLVLLSEQFRRARLYRLWLLSYMLILLISAPIIGEWFER